MSTYKDMEEVLKLINRKYVTLKTEEVTNNNEVLKSTLEKLINAMKNEDPIFKKLYKETYYGGSYWDDLKVQNPNEFDLDLLLVLPKKCETHEIENCGCVSVTPSDIPGYLCFKIEENYCGPLKNFIMDGYMQTNLVLNWQKSLVTKALTRLKDSGDVNYYEDLSFHSESGPALTLGLRGKFGFFFVDVVLAFEFGSKYWPNETFIRPNETSKSNFFIVPKKPKNVDENSERYWRPSFQDQEKELIKGKERLKPSLRLLKKMRISLKHTLSSYALKTIALWDLHNNDTDWNGTLSDTFMSLLEKYRESLNDKEILFYWNEKNNLLDPNFSITWENHYNEICRKISLIKREYKTNPCIVAKVILKEGTEEYNEFMREFKSQELADNMGDISIRSSNDDYLNPSDAIPIVSQQTESVSQSGWIAGLVIGAAVLIAATTISAVRRNNRD